MTDHARGRVLDAGGPELLERLDHLDRRDGSRETLAAPRSPDRGATPDYDVVLAGGGLSILYAVPFARAGLRVAVVERAAAGTAHREWNASRAELERLVEAGLCTHAELDGDLIVARYTRGLCRWHGGGTYAVRGVLDCAVDAGALVALARTRATALGVTFIDRTTALGVAPGADAISLLLRGPDGATRELVTRVVVDARGASSPFASADLVCPTVGGVLRGLREGDGPREIRPDVGEILATTEHALGGRQYLWEAFPGRAGETTVYLFHYARRADATAPGLVELYGRFFESLGRYKDGDATLVRPTFGLIPGWSRLTPAPASGHPRVVLVGDAAARHSPLTFCGFGATLRSLAPSVEAVCLAADGAPLDSGTWVHDSPVHAGTGALALLLASLDARPGRASYANELLDVAFSVLAEMGEEAFGRMLRDEATAEELVAFLRATAARRPDVYREVFGRLGTGRVMRWGAGIVGALLRG